MENRVIDFYPRPLRKGHVGLEVEVEFVQGSTLPNPPGGVWLVDEDDSLKNGLEYKTRQPLAVGEKKIEKIKVLTDLLAAAPIVQNSPRTSVHVHCNVQTKTPLQVWNAAVAYYLLEEPLMIYCGKEHRVGNHFCLRLSDAEKLMRIYQNDVRTPRIYRPFQKLDQDEIKYSAFNMATVPLYGTVEFRGMRGVYDPHIIDLWSDTCHKIVSMASSFETPDRVLDFYLQAEKDQFLLYFLPDEIIEFLKNNTDYRKLIRKGASIIYGLAYHHDWKLWGELVDKSLKELVKEPEKQPHWSIPDEVSLVTESVFLNTSATETTSWTVPSIEDFDDGV